MRYIVAFIFFLVEITLATSVDAYTYYVATNGSDSNPGTVAQPFLTIQKAANTMVAGDTAMIRQGTYNERVTVSRSGRSDAYITFQNYPYETVTISAQATRSTCISISSGASYLQFIGLHLTGASTVSPYSGFYAIDNSHHLILDGIESDYNKYGMRFEGSTNPVSYVTVKNCKCHNNERHGVFFYKKVYDSEVGPNNQFYSNSDGTTDVDSYGLEISSDFPGTQDMGAKRIYVHDNEMYSNEEQGMRTWQSMWVLIQNNYFHNNGATGVQIEDGSQYIVIEGNRSEYNAQVWEYETGGWADSSSDLVVRNNRFGHNKIGFMVSSCSRVIAHGNYIYDNNRGVPDLTNAMGLAVDYGVSNLAFAHNTLYNNGASSSGHGSATLGYHSGTYSNLKMKNNILSNAGSPRDLEVGTYGASVFSSDYNLVYNTRTLSISYNGSTLSWANYLSQSGDDSHSLTSNPMFSSTTEFTIPQSSPAVDRGDFLTLTTSSGTGTVVSVTDASFFTDGFSTGASGDTVQIGTQTAVITSVNYTSNTLTLDRPVAWTLNQGVSLAYSGSKPDIGAYEYSYAVVVPDAPTGLRIIP